MLRILMLVCNLPGGGTYLRALALGQGLSARGHSVTLVATSRTRRKGFDVRLVKGVSVVEAPDLLPGSLRSGWDPWGATARIAWLRESDFDLVHAFENRPVNLLPALYFRHRRGLPILSDWCDWFGRGGSVEERPSALVRTLLRPVETFLEEKPRRHTCGLTVINTVLRDKAMALGVPRERILLLPNGASVQEIRPSDRRQARQHLGLPLNAKLIAYPGAIFRQDAQLMAQAFDRIHAAQPKAMLLLVGCNVAVEELVQSPESVIRAGPVNYLVLGDYLAACDLGWLPLRDSGANRGRFPMKLHDFLAAGRAVVATDVGDIGGLLRRTQVGRVAPDEPEALAEAVLALLADDRERGRLGRNARHVAETEYAWPLMAERLERFYMDILSGQPAPLPSNGRSSR